MIGKAKVRSSMWFGLALLFAACSPSDDTDLEVTISASSDVVSPSQPVTFTVSVENRGDSRIVWSMGSSTCQLALTVEVEGQDYPAHNMRGCTMDYVEQGLDSGESRSEALTWLGHIRRDSLELLPPGVYGVRAVAGDLARSAPIEIKVVASE